MVDVKPTNKKLINRAINMVQQITECDKEMAEKAFEESGRNPKIAIVMIKKNITKEEATKELNKFDGFLKKVIV